MDTAVLSRNVHVLVEALARHIFNIDAESTSQIFSEGLRVEENLLSAWLDYLGGEARSAQLLDKDSAVVVTLQQTMARHLKEVRTSTFKADKR